MEAPRVAITGVGAVTPIGTGAWAAAAAARAGLCGFREHPSWVDSAGTPMRLASVRWLDPALSVAGRCARMLVAAIREVLAEAWPAGRTALFVGLPPGRPGCDDDLDARLRRAVEERFEGGFDRIVNFAHGHAASLLALEAAVAGLRSGAFDACIVAGVDSYLSAETLEWIDASDQLHGGGALNNAWGFVPGEAAGAVLLQRSGADGRVSLGEIVAVGTGRETALIKSDAVCIGAGLTQAFRAALRALPPELRIDEIYGDMNGEAYRADEYGFTCLRTRERFVAATDFVAAADCWGDLGAAGAPLHLLLAIAACRKGYAKGPTALVWASSESGERGAVVISAAVARRE